VIRAALVATLLLVIAEFVAGILGHSLALISDAWHNLGDVPALAFSSLALHFGQKPPDELRTYGYQRAGVLAGFVNSLILLGVAVYVCVEGYARVIHPQPVASGVMLVVGVVALAVNGGVSLALSRQQSDLNLRSVFIHYVGDSLSDVGIIASAVLIRLTGQRILDPIAAFLIAGMILWGAVGIIGESGSILLESLPRGMDLERVARAMLAVPGVRGVHDVHIWSLGSDSHALSCHIHILDMPTSESERIAHRVREVLAAEFGIMHTTIQFEHTHQAGAFHPYMPEPAGKKANT
jgi:cobalt-zinc-cadmium efflux system protein